VILDTDPKAAKKVTIEVYESVDGQHWRTEEAARYSSCTHRACQQCGAPAEKMYTVCPDCREKNKQERFMAMPVKEWDGIVPLYCPEEDAYYSEPEEGLNLIICEPNTLRTLDSDFWYDQMSEDQEIPEDLEDAIAKLNEVIQSLPPINYSPGKFRFKLKQ
jgi:hypothetical protein